MKVKTEWFNECRFAEEISALFRAGRGDWAPPREVDALEPNADMQVTVVSDADRMLGFGVHYEAPQWHCEFLYLLFVKPEARRQGIGSLIISRCAEISRLKGHTSVKLGTVPNNDLMHALMARAGATQFAIYYQLPA
jgi:GNAT superfamily N-acetyltransferase